MLSMVIPPMVTGRPSTFSYSINWGVAATENKSPNEGYKEIGPTDVIHTELSKLGYISVVGEIDTGDLGEIRNT